MTKAKNILDSTLQDSLSELISMGGQIILQIDLNTPVKGEKTLKFSATSQTPGSPVVSIPQQNIMHAIVELSVTSCLFGFTITEEQQRNKKCVTITKNKMSGKSAIPLNEVLAKLQQNKLTDLNDFNAIETTLLKMRQHQNLHDIGGALTDGKAEMFDVVSNKPIEDLEALLETGMDIEQEILDESLILALQSETNPLEKVDLLLQYNANPNYSYTYTDNRGLSKIVTISALYWALKSKKDTIDLTKKLLEYEANPDQFCYSFSTKNPVILNIQSTQCNPLYLALTSQKDSQALTHALVSKGANVNVFCYTNTTVRQGLENTNNLTPLHVALNSPNNSFNLTKYLAEKAKVNAKDPVSTLSVKSTYRDAVPSETKSFVADLVTYVDSSLSMSPQLRPKFARHAAILLQNNPSSFENGDVINQIQAAIDLGLDLDYDTESPPFYQLIWQAGKSVVDFFHNKIVSRPKEGVELKNGSSSEQITVITEQQLQLEYNANRELPSQVPESPQPKASLWDKVLSCLNLFSWFGSGKGKGQSETKVGENVGSGDEVKAESGQSLEAPGESPQPKASLLSKVLSCLNLFSWFGSGKSKEQSKGQSETKVEENVGSGDEVKAESGQSLEAPGESPQPKASLLSKEQSETKVEAGLGVSDSKGAADDTEGEYLHTCAVLLNDLVASRNGSDALKPAQVYGLNVNLGFSGGTSTYQMLGGVTYSAADSEGNPSNLYALTNGDGQ